MKHVGVTCVYFDLQTGASHFVCWSNYPNTHFFLFLQICLIWKQKSRNEAKKKYML